MAAKKDQAQNVLAHLMAGFAANAVEQLIHDPRVRDPAAAEIRRRGHGARSTIMADTAIMGYIQTLDIPDPLKHFLEQIVDSVFDVIRHMPEDTDMNTMLRSFNESARRAMLTLRSKVAKGDKPAAKFPKIEAELGDAQREKLLRWVLWMRNHHEKGYKRWESLKPLIDSKDRLERALNMVADAADDIRLPVIVQGKPFDFQVHWRNTEKRLTFLENALKPPPTIIEVVEAILKGESNPYTKELEEKISEAAKRFGDSAEAHNRAVKRLGQLYGDED